MTERVTVVFGGTGFLGRRIVRQLLRQDCQVRVAARNPAAANFAGHHQLVPMAADIQDERAVAEAISGAAAVVNAVSLYAEKGDLTFDAIHVQGAERIARCAKAAGVERLLHVSGIGVDRHSRSRFVRARARGEAAVTDAFEGATIIRPSVMVACRESFLKALDDVTRLPVVPLFGRGETRLQPVHVDDVAEAIVRLSQSGEQWSSVFELGGGKTYTYRQSVQVVLNNSKRKRLLLPVPFPVWYGMASALSLLPLPPLTRDQLILMEGDNIVHANANSFTELKMQPRSLEEVAADCYSS